MNGTASHDIDLDEATEEVSFVGFFESFVFFWFLKIFDKDDCLKSL